MLKFRKQSNNGMTRDPTCHTSNQHVGVAALEFRDRSPDRFSCWIVADWVRTDNLQAGRTEPLNRLIALVLDNFDGGIDLTETYECDLGCIHETPHSKAEVERIIV
jgi:hypothetical protein